MPVNRLQYEAVTTDDNLGLVETWTMEDGVVYAKRVTEWRRGPGLQTVFVMPNPDYV